MGAGTEIRRISRERVYRKWRGCNGIIIVFVVLFGVSDFFGNVMVEAATGEEAGRDNATVPSDTPIPQIRYRTRPVASFRSIGGAKPNNNSSTSLSDSNIPETSGFEVHDLTSQTFEKLHENWKNLQQLLRNLQTRRSQDESQRSSSSSQSGGVPTVPVESRENTYRRFPPFGSNSNVYSLRYHPVLEGQGSTSLDDAGRGTPARTLGGLGNFNPFPYDPKGQESKDVDMERHTVATIYTIGICLTIMAIGSVMFILINKCDGGSSYVRSDGASRGPGGRITRSMMSAVSGQPRQGRTRRGGGRDGGGRGGRTSGSSNNNNDISAGVEAVLSENDAKILTDLPPSYSSLFPEGGPNLKDVIVQPQASTSTMTVSETNPNLINSSRSSDISISNTQNENAATLNS